jgi:hypothetical protein
MANLFKLVISSDNGLPLDVTAPGSQAHAVFYQFSTGANSPAQGLTCSSGNNAFTAYQVAMLPGP